MKEYIIVTNLYSPKGGLYKFAENPEKSPFKSSFNANQRQDFVEKWKYVIKEDTYFDPPKVFYIDYDSVEIVDITDKLEELESQI